MAVVGVCKHKTWENLACAHLSQLWSNECALNELELCELDSTKGKLLKKKHFTSAAQVNSYSKDKVFDRSGQQHPSPPHVGLFSPVCLHTAVLGHFNINIYIFRFKLFLQAASSKMKRKRQPKKTQCWEIIRKLGLRSDSTPLLCLFCS